MITKPDGLYIGKVHGWEEIILLKENKPHILEKDGKKSSWIETVMEDSRLKKFRPIFVEDLVDRVLRSQHDCKS